MSEFDEKVANFLETPKRLARRIRWKAQRPDYAKTSVPVIIGNERRPEAHLGMNLHLTRIPRKYSFSLVFQGIRVAGLDVGPGRVHTNLLTLQRVWDTRWQFWPAMDAVTDNRLLSHHLWLDEFLQKCKICDSGKYVEPPFEAAQLGFDVNV